MKNIHLLDRIRAHIPHRDGGMQWTVFSERLDSNFEKLFTYLKDLYGTDDDFLYFLEDLLSDMWKAIQRRPESLIQRDKDHDAESQWFMSNEIIGGVCYVDLFAGDLQQLLHNLDYIEEIDINYLHIMPVFASPEDESDGGYAVSSYRKVNERLGIMDDLRELTIELHKRHIVLVSDFILNHTSDQHQWAQKAQQGNAYYKDFYFIFPDRVEPDQYQRCLRDIFPEVRSGSFTYHKKMDSWIWTTFNSFQWDLNYHNHEVFLAMANEMFFLANTGIDVLRFDAIAFIWKEKGSSCESLPKAHTLVRAFRTLARIAAPSLVFKSEAIVHPSEVISYINHDECELSYNPLLMSTAWEALATRDPSLLARSVRSRYRLNNGCSWVNYIRCHDDIGWTFDDNDAWALGVDPQEHRKFLNSFYTGSFPGSFARGLPFQRNKVTGDCRISGTCASLAGLEKGILLSDQKEIDYAISKIGLLHGIASTLGGIPLIYIGDELGVCNDYSYRDVPAKAYDSRWAHRIPFDWDAAEQRKIKGTTTYRIFTMIQHLIKVRKQLPVLSMGTVYIHNMVRPHLFAYDRLDEKDCVTIIANFSDYGTLLDNENVVHRGMVYRDHITEESVRNGYMMKPWQFMVIQECENE